MTTNLMSLYLPQGIWASVFMRDSQFLHFPTPTYRREKYQRLCQINYTLKASITLKIASWLAWVTF